MGAHNSSPAKIRQKRQQLGLTVRDVEAASQVIARQHGNRAFVVHCSRLSEVENHARAPNVAFLYSLAVIFNHSLPQVCSWFGLDVDRQAADRKLVEPVLEGRRGAKRARQQKRAQAAAERSQRALQKRRERERRKQRLVQWLRRGISVAQAAQRFGVSRQYVYQLAAEAGFSRSKPRRRERARQQRRLRFLLRRGLSYAQAAQRLGVSRQRLYQVVPRGARPLELRRQLREP